MKNPLQTEVSVLVVDYGVGNVKSVTNALERLGYRYTVSSALADIAAGERYILPGVGAFEEAMRNLRECGIIDALKEEVVSRGKPLLGICLGMQVLAEDSTENGMHQGLGLIPGHVVRIEAHDQVRVPHVGWNNLSVSKTDPLFARIAEGSRFYFDHSYHFAAEAAYVAATCEYGAGITAAVQHGSIFGVQFHPEKSQNNGLRLIRAFCEYTPL